jgi:hypothetical protein
MLMEQMHYNLLFRWFVGLEMDEPVWNHAVFSKKPGAAAEPGGCARVLHALAGAGQGISIGRTF